METTLTVLFSLILTLVLSFYMFGRRKPSDDAGKGIHGSIPEPPKLPILGHTLLIDRIHPSYTLRDLYFQYGDIYQLQFPGVNMVLINSHALALEVYDEKRFHKGVAGPLEELRVFVKDALFTAYHGEPNWGIAHRILMPAFSPVSIKSTFTDMFDICSQLCLRWERFGDHTPIDPNEDFTKLAFDTVTLCTMGYRNNSFYLGATDPFINALRTFMVYAEERSQLPKIFRLLKGHTDGKYQELMDIMSSTVDEVIATRRKNGGTRQDLLELMLYGKDPKTGQGLDDESIRSQLITFLVAGHETTSGLLSLSMYYLLKHPEAYRKLQQEVDSVLGRDPIQAEHLGKLLYVTAVLRETLRLSPTVPIHLVQAFEDTMIAGKYFVPKGQLCVIQFNRLHRDPSVWGDDADDFKPERMLDGKFEALPAKAWMPFGNGSRSCIGRAFAWQESIIAVATIFQRFNLRLKDPNYTLETTENLTIKPLNFFFYAIPRAGISTLIATKPSTSRGEPTKTKHSPSTIVNSKEPKQAIRVLYGSNTGSSLSFAERIATSGPGKGFKATLQTLDDAAAQLPLPKEPLIIITASFEGEPADNAVQFVKNLQASNMSFEGMRYAVFGCGNKDWVHTYQKIPRFIDNALSEKGGQRILPLGEGNAGADDFFESFETWEESLWDTLIPRDQAQGDDLDEALDIELVGQEQERATALRHPNLEVAYVKENRLLTKLGAPEKRHIELILPSGMKYRAGDYLTILPTNPETSVKKVLRHFKYSPETHIKIRAGDVSSLPTGTFTLHEILSGYVELAQPATKRNLRTLSRYAAQDVKITLHSLLERYNEEILKIRISVVDLLMAFPTIELPFSRFLNMLPPMRIRQYSISSSPLSDPNLASLTITVFTSQALSGSGELFHGVGSTFLSSLEPGDQVQLAVRQSAAIFSLPTDATVPVVLFCAGSGIAPMRGFIQERAALLAEGREVGKTLLFFGCRRPTEDFLYSDSDLKEWQRIGAVNVRPAFSQQPDQSFGCKYVQDRILHDGDDVISLYKNGRAKFFICGSSSMARGIQDAYCKLLERSEECDAEAAAEIFRRLQKEERYATDIFG